MANAVVFGDTSSTIKEKPKDEIKEYYDCRYISACEASWRIFSNEVHYRYPAVMRLPFHLPGQQNVVYGADDDIDNVLSKPSVASSIFMQWMKLNETNEDARKLTYVEFPSKFVWILKDRCWQVRKLYQCVGLIHSVSPALGEPYFLRILLNKVKGPRSFEEIRTVNGQLFLTFRDACYAMGLLDDDNEYVEAIKEASFEGHAGYLRALFATLLLSNTLSRPEFVWENTWKYLADDIVYRRLVLPEHQIKKLTLLKIENYLISNGSSLRRFATMPYPDDDSLRDASNRLINEELSHDLDEVQAEFNRLHQSLTDEQRAVFDEIMEAVVGRKGGLFLSMVMVELEKPFYGRLWLQLRPFFVYGYGGTGNGVVLNVASSGIASLLLSRGRITHSRFHIPINLTEDSMCNIKPNSDIARLLKETQLIIWDEAPMVHKHAFEALDRTMTDVFSEGRSIRSDIPFGGKVIVFGGDFRQILPVIPNSTRQEIVSASLSSSYIWAKCRLLWLTKNMRLTIGAQSSNMKSIREFAKWLIDIGEGNVGDDNDGDAIIEIPDDLLITDICDPIQSLIDFVYPSVIQQFRIAGFFSERAILAPKNEVVHEINDRLLSLFPGDAKEYLSSDSICQTEQILDSFQQSLYSTENLNALKISGLPNHRLVLKVGVPVMLLRNIDQQKGLCNGSRLQITFLAKRVIEAEVISGGNIGTRVFIPRINMILSDKKIPFQFQRRQFPLSVCFAMTINKSQGQSLSKVGLYLKDHVFTHGQLYVALSRVKTREGVKILILDADGKPTNKTSNVVYKEVFTSLFYDAYYICKFLHNPESLKLDVPIFFANQNWGDCWQKSRLQIFHESDLNLPRDTLLVFKPLGDFGLELSCYVNGMCGESYFTFNRYTRFGFTVIEGCYIEQFYVNSPPRGKFQICYKVPTGMLRIDDFVFEVVVYRDEIEICFLEKPESNDDSVVEISKADYVDNAFKVKVQPLLRLRRKVKLLLRERRSSRIGLREMLPYLSTQVIILDVLRLFIKLRYILAS
ncbi:uncharacterized protein LOC110913706 [Helianthus annuus]|uniref:uncharacterized protein LOC110913706 n=1 Tax=Helianthus annuus TaxID=4232 RepID=UPI000B9043F3|nr:uncharacterized protein LOC110913706 [Helianthus annuus]